MYKSNNNGGRAKMFSTELAEAGIGMHHAGLSLSDRRLTESEFLNGKLRILCTTSTLAVGVSCNPSLPLTTPTAEFVDR
jgi:ATP-dependent DNA helicase HFM1/MER3